MPQHAWQHSEQEADTMGCVAHVIMMRLQVPASAGRSVNSDCSWHGRRHVM